MQMIAHGCLNSDMSRDLAFRPHRNQLICNDLLFEWVDAAGIEFA